MAEITPIRTPAETALVELFPTVRASLPGDAGIAGRRDAAFEAFRAQGLPHRRVEAYKYTDLRTLLRETAPLAPAPDAADIQAAGATADVFAGVDAVRVTLVDGHLVPSLSGLSRLPAGVEAVGLADALAAGHPLVAAHMGAVARNDGDPVNALNAAFVSDGVVIRVKAGTTVAKPILVRNVLVSGTPVAVYTRVLLIVEEGASVTLVESHEAVSAVAHHANTVVEVLAGDRTTVHHVRANTRGGHAFDLSALAVRLGGHAAFTSVGVALAAAVSRHQVNVRLAGEHSTLTIGGAALLSGRQHADSTLIVEHVAPHCASRELFKNVLDGESTGVFQGKIVVESQAQKTDGRMMSQAVLLADGAAMYNKPELEIFADDVQCAHGATCGALDDDLLFYLRARGLPKPDAEALMLQAFVGEALDLVENDAAREALSEAVEGWLRARM
ncbi:MAG: Fe-S cluster assembly protein SufD [Burkholderiales bacterium]|nr:Fe-S cluster assembly protein SufD [Burkholderiales bacterium]